MLNKNSLGRIAFAVSAFALASAAMAGESTGTVNVGATLTSACEVTGTPAISFGSITALNSSGDKTADSGSSFQVACSSDTSPTIYSSTARTVTDGASHTLAFNLSLTAGAASDDLPTASGSATALTLTKNGSPQTVPLYAKVLASNFKALPAGTYSTDITVAVKY